MKDNNNTTTSTWRTVGIREKIAIITAVVAFTLGWTLTGIAAFVPLFLSEQSVLWVLGQALLYSSSVFGVTAYFQSESKKLRRDIKDMFRFEEQRLKDK